MIKKEQGKNFFKKTEFLLVFGEIYETEGSLCRILQLFFIQKPM